MISIPFYVEFVKNNSQKCQIPSHVISCLNARIGDYVSIRSASRTTICKIYHAVSYSSLLVPQIICDTSVEVKNTSPNNGTTIGSTENTFSSSNFPQDFRLLSPVLLNKIKIRIVFKDIKTLMNWPSAKELEMYVRPILYQYGVVLNSFIACEKHPLGSLYGITKIHILELDGCQDGNVGKTAASTLISLESVVSENYLNQFQENSEVHIGGLDHLVSALKSFVQLCYSRKNKCHWPRILLIGPSGCGKSSVVKKLAYDMNAYLISIQAIDLCRMKISDIKNFFETVEQGSLLSSNVPCILFIDDIINRRASKRESVRMIYLTLALLDVCMSYENLFIFGASNSSKTVPAVLKKFGRFTKEIHIGVPTLEQRENILKTLMADLNFRGDVKEIAEKTPGYVGSDLSQLVLNAEHFADENNSTEGLKLKAKEMNSVVTIDHFRDALRVVRPSLLKTSNFKLDVQPMYWSDIGGLEAIKRRAKIFIEWPILYPTAFLNAGLPSPKGVLLYGPPGCCKTTLVRVLATECKATFLTTSAAQIYSCFVGDSEKAVVELFHQARLCAPSIIFLDEIESLVGKRSHSGDHRGVQEKVLSTFLNEMDGFGVKTDSLQGVNAKELVTDENSSSSDEDISSKSNQSVLVVGATNRIDLIDDALLRPGRFDCVLYVPPPNRKERKAILEKIARKADLADELLEWVAEKTEFFSGADLKNLYNAAGMNAFKNASELTKEDFISALKYIHPSITRTDLQNYEHTASKYGSVTLT